MFLPVRTLLQPGLLDRMFRKNIPVLLNKLKLYNIVLVMLPHQQNIPKSMSIINGNGCSKAKLATERFIVAKLGTGHSPLTKRVRRDGQ